LTPFRSCEQMLVIFFIFWIPGWGSCDAAVPD
jgi:hypothetical protein